MVTAELVVELVDEGRELLGRLVKSGFDLDIAFWAIRSVDNKCYLYIASPLVDRDGAAASYRVVSNELRQSPTLRISTSDIQLIGSENPMAHAAMAWRHDTLGIRYGGRSLGDVVVEAAYIYPKALGHAD